jgi:hypothetical protein
VLLALLTAVALATPAIASEGATAAGAAAPVESASLPAPVIRKVASRPTTELVRTAAQGESAPPPPPPPASWTSPGASAWTTPPPAGTTWSAPAPVPYPAQPVRTLPAAPMTAAPAAAVPLGQRCWSGCGLPCESGVSAWHVRGWGGYAFYAGTDTPESCGYFGVDLGRTFCGCWGLDAFYRRSSGQFTRTNALFGEQKDGGYVNHIGVKFTWENSIGGSRFYYWAGVGPEYFWTEQYIVNDSGLGFYGEIGVGYVISKNFRVLAGLDVHGDYTDVTRRNAAQAGEKRWLWTLAPVVGLQIDF